MNPATRFLATSLLLLPLPSAHSETFSPESAAVRALRHNRDLAASRFLIAEAEARLVQAGLWNNPEFQVSGETGTRNGRDWEASAGFMQEFPLAGRLRKAKAVARIDIAMAIEELRNQERLLAGQVLRKGRDLLLLQRKLAVNAENGELLARIHQQTLSLVTTGKAGVSEAQVVELEQATLSLERDGLLVEQRAATADLNGLLGRGPEASLALAGALPPVPSPTARRAAAAAANSRRPDRQLAALETGRFSAEERLARAASWENLRAGFDLGREREMEMHETMVGLAFSLPLPLWNRNQGRIAETRAAQERALAQVAARELAIASEIREAEERLTGLAAILNRTRGPTLALARKNTALLEQTYPAGASSFLTVLESQRQWLALERSAIETEARLASAITDWEMRTLQFPAPVLHALTAPAPGTCE